MSLEGKFVKVIWHDAADHEKTWVKESEIDSFNTDPIVIESFGFLLRRTKRYVTIAADQIIGGAGEETVWGRVTKVPAGMVRSIKEIVL